MPASAEFLELLRDQMRALGPVAVRRMFGGAGLFVDGLMFALVIDDTLFLKSDMTTEPRFVAEGLEPFSYETRHSRRTLTSYWRAPERVLDEPDEMVHWAGAAIAVARRAAAAKPQRKAALARKARSKPASAKPPPH